MAKKNDKSGRGKGKNTENNSEKAKANSQKKRSKEDNLQPWKPGQSGNPKGRPKGRKNQSTMIWEAMKFIAEQETEKSGNTVTAEDIEKRLHASAIAMALRNHNFYNSVMDRLHRRPDHVGDVKESSDEDLPDEISELSDEQLRRIAEGG